MKGCPSLFRVVVIASLVLPAWAQAAASKTVSSQSPITARELPENARGYIRGYLRPDDLPDSAALLPPPPTAGSPAALADEVAHRAARTQTTPERRALATADANLRFPGANAVFASALGQGISMQQTPHLVTILRRSLTDAARATDAAKSKHQRVRPFALYGEACCTPDEEPALRNNGAYPSGHAAIGWAWALILAELVPERANALLARGYEFGQSRVICGVHWQSDVDAGRLVGSAVVARLHADPVFVAQLVEAKKEIHSARTR